MKQAEKEQLNTFLDTSFSWISGFPIGVCAGNKSPFFSDDMTIESNTTKETSVQNFNVMNNITSKIISCSRCSLCKTCKNFVVGTGVENPLVMVIGDFPSEKDDIQGLPFVNDAGQLLDKMLLAINLHKNQNCYITNIIKCRPPMGRDPKPEELDACRSFLDAQIQTLKPKIIITLGRIASQSLLKSSQNINQLHGKFHDYKGIPVMPIYHPNALLRDERLKRPAWIDLQAVHNKLFEN
ncbi:MAG: uracil-DNA glycosylase [Treponema sp.]|nr:uracil-DNA glycosylase [Treponema sp.]